VNFSSYCSDEVFTIINLACRQAPGIALDFIRPDKGNVFIKGEPSTDSKSRRHIGYMPEHPHFYEQGAG